MTAGHVLLAAAPATQLTGVFGFLQPVLQHYGYVAVALVLFLENMLLPFPGETVLVAAAVYAGAGQLNIVLVGIIAIAAALAGSATGYIIGAKAGRRIIDRYGRYVLLTSARMDKVEDFFARRGPVVVVVGRFIEGVRQLMAITAGISEMSFKEFMFWTAIGATLWTAVWLTLGYVAGSHVDEISRYSTYFFVLVALGVAFAAWRHLRHRRPTTD